MSQTYAQSAVPAARPAEAPAPSFSDVVYPLMGLAITAILPGIFWTALIGLVASGLGYPFNGTTLGSIAIAITAFLSLIWAALARRGGADEQDAA